MNYNFDKITDRKNTNSLKYDFSLERGKPEGVLPLWVADMDFPLPDQILQELHTVIDHGIFGYTEVKDDYFNTLFHWFSTHFHWKIKKEWLVKTPGIVFAIAQAVRAFTNEGDTVLIQQPVYYPFSECITNNNRVLINNQLHYENGTYSIDFADFESKIIAHHVKLFLLCSPHNPVGRVWTKEELHKLGEICVRHNVIIVSDEIHCDFTYSGHEHTVLASISEELADHCIICTSPSKTFNIAGLQVSNLFIPNSDIRKRFLKELNACGYSQLNRMGLAACQIAYDKGGEWLSRLKEYLTDNLSFVRTYLTANLPELKLIEPEGTYLIWIDCSSLHLTSDELEDLIVKKAGLWLDSGRIFGAETSQFQRINIACPRSILKQALDQLSLAIHKK